MKIGILGTRGIPNFHGGFEQFAEYLSAYLAKRNHEVYVYNSHKHPYQKPEWRGVKIVRCYDPEHKIGTAGQFVYDLNCIRDSRQRGFDLILQLGYTSSSIWGSLLPKSAVIVTNMDGLEWKRSKYSKPVQGFLRRAEKWAVRSSDYLVADSLGIQKYLREKYSVDSKYIAYGAQPFQNPDPGILNKYSLSPEGYNMLIARIEPENNIETILDGVVQSGSEMPFIVIGKTNTPLAHQLLSKYANIEEIRFLGGIYNQENLDNLRYFSNIYFHGHSVGGTNPSLLEAMASGAFIVAHDNIFNKSILKENAFYFKTAMDVGARLSLKKQDFKNYILANRLRIENEFEWIKINQSYEEFLESCLQKKQE